MKLKPADQRSTGSLSLGPRARTRPAGVSFICHLTNVGTYLVHHRTCDGKSYTPSITDRGVPCTCDCHGTP